MKNIIKLIILVLFLSPALSNAQIDVDQGGTGNSSFSQGGFLYGNGSSALGASSSPTVDYITATSGTSTFPRLSVTTAVNILGTYITNLSTWFSNLFNSNFATKNTGDLAEGVNLYYTDARVGSYISGSSTVPHAGGSAWGDLLRWTGSAWASFATSTLGIAWGDLRGVPAGFADGIDDTGNASGNASDRWATSTDLTSIYPNTATNVGIGTTSPYAALSVVGSTGVVAEKYTATGTVASTFPYASSTAISASVICLLTDCRSSWPSGGGGAYAWTPTSNYGEVTSATTSPLWIKGNFYASSTARLSTTTAPSINNILYGAYAGGADGGAKANTAYNLLSGGGLIDFTNQGLQTLSTAIDFSTAGKRVLLQGGTGSSTVFHSTLAGTSTTINWGSGNVGDQDHDFGAGIDGLTFRGGDDVFDTSVGVVLGGSNGAEGSRISHSRITNFAKGLVIQNNTWNTSIDNSMFNGSGRNFVWEADTNAGENISIVSSVFADSWSGSSTNNYYKCFDVSKGGVGISMVNTALDDCQLYVGNSSIISLTNPWIENSAGDGTGNKYTFIHLQPSEYTTLSVSGGTIAQVATADMPDQLIYNGGNTLLSGLTVLDTGGGVAPYLVANDNLNGGGSIVLSGVSNIGGSAFAHVTNKDPSDYDVTADGYRYIQYYAQNQDSYPFIMHVTPQSDTLFWSGNHQALTMSAAGYFGLGTTTPKYALHVYRANGTNAESCITQGTFSEFCTKAQDAHIRQTYSDPLYWDSDGVGTTRMTLLTNGNLGLGTTSPYAALSVVGSTGVVAEKYTATGTATSTFAWDINIASGHCIQYNGSCISLTGGTSGATTTWRSIVQAWIYPGETTCQADEEYKDGRQIHTLKPEYIALNNNGTHAIDTVAVSGCNGYSVNNAQDVASSSAEQFFTISGNATGFAALMGSASLQASLIATSTAYATSTGFTGVEIDIEGYHSWSAADTLTYYTFLTNFANTLHANGKKLMVDLPPIWNSAANTDSGTGDEWDSANSTGYYNLTYQAMNATPVDYFVIMAYDYHFDYGGGASIQPLKWVGDIVAFAKKKIPDTNRIVIGMPAYGYQATTAGYDITNQTYGLMTLETGFGTAVRDGASGEMKWTNGGQSYVYNDSVSLDIKRTYIESLGISRVSVWHLGDNLWFTSPEESGGKMEMGNLPQVVREATTTLQSLALGGTSTPSAQFEIKGLMPTLVRIFTSTGTKVMEIIDDLVNFENARVRQHVYSSFSYATSTTWTGTTTIQLGVEGVTSTWSRVWCYTNTGTLNVSILNNTSRMNLFNASTTIGTTTLSTNNAIPAGTKRSIEIGTPASSPTNIACTVDKIQNK